MAVPSRALRHPSVINAKPTDSDGGLHAMEPSNMFSVVNHVCCMTQLVEQHSDAAQHARGELRQGPAEECYALHLCFQARMSKESQLAPHPRM